LGSVQIENIAPRKGEGAPGECWLWERVRRLGKVSYLVLFYALILVPSIYVSAVSLSFLVNILLTTHQTSIRKLPQAV